MKATGIDLTKEIFDYNNSQYSSYIYFFTEDNGCRIFDLYSEDCIYVYNGILPFKKDIIKIINREEFEKEFGQYTFYDTVTYRVYWKNIGYSWNN